MCDEEVPYQLPANFNIHRWRSPTCCQKQGLTMITHSANLRGNARRTIRCSNWQEPSRTASSTSFPCASASKYHGLRILHVHAESFRGVAKRSTLTGSRSLPSSSKYFSCGLSRLGLERVQDGLNHPSLPITSNKTNNLTLVECDYGQCATGKFELLGSLRRPSLGEPC